MNTIYLRDADVAKRFGVSRSCIWDWLKADPTFPKPVNLSPRFSRWRLDDLERWELSKRAVTAA